MALIPVTEQVEIDMPQLSPHRQIDALEKIDVPDAVAFVVVVATRSAASRDDPDWPASLSAVDGWIANHVSPADGAHVRVAVKAHQSLRPFSRRCGVIVGQRYHVSDCPGDAEIHLRAEPGLIAAHRLDRHLASQAGCGVTAGLVVCATDNDDLVRRSGLRRQCT
jgi:hypothetical protein